MPEDLSVEWLIPFLREHPKHVKVVYWDGELGAYRPVRVVGNRQLAKDENGDYQLPENNSAGNPLEYVVVLKTD